MSVAQVPSRFLLPDEVDAIEYWRDRPHKKWAVDFRVGPAKHPVRVGTIYVGAATPAAAVRCARANAYPALPAAAHVVARLAGPRELGCIRTGSPA